ncbi:succinate-CoA ligase, alpha subunit [delta proteobacterium NaphS2]|nr:succinate-CoA ligase, alpha subunit [delta proteobacterium NaphS2]
MSILIDEGTRLLVQGITGSEGGFYTHGCIEYGTNVVAGVTPGKGGSLWAEKVPVFNTVENAVRETGANASIIFVPAAFAADAAFEAAYAGLSPIILITEFIPTLDMARVRNFVKEKGVYLIGPNCPGVISPGKCKAGIMIPQAFMPGRVGVISRSGTLTYEVAAMLTEKEIGQSTCVGVGGDQIPGTTMAEVLALFEKDAETDAVVLIGEIGGGFEQTAAEFIREKMSKPVVAFIAGSTAPPGRRMGHAGAIVTGKEGRAEEKKKALADAGATVVDTPPELSDMIKKVLNSEN